MVSARSYFGRMNENRGGGTDNNSNWLNDEQLLIGTEECFKLNDYSNIEYDKVLDQGRRTFISPIVASKITKYDEDNDKEEIDQTIVSMFKSKVK
jgi:hypothetical protein